MTNIALRAIEAAFLVAIASLLAYSVVSMI